MSQVTTKKIMDPLKFAECPSGNFCLKALEEIRHGLPNKRLSGTSFNFLIWKNESNQMHVSGQTLRNSSSQSRNPFGELAHSPLLIARPFVFRLSIQIQGEIYILQKRIAVMMRKIFLLLTRT